MEKPSSPNVDPKRLRYSTMALGSLFVLAGLSQAKLQVVERGHTLDLAQNAKRFIVRVKDKARRGSILSSDGKPLAQDAHASVLTLNFEKIPHTAAFYMDLSEASGIPATEFQALETTEKKIRSWPEPISPDQAEAINQVKSDWRADGVSVDPSNMREYPLGSSAASLVGVVREFGAQVDGKYEKKVVPTGIESSENQILEGSDGERIGMTDKSGAFLPMRMEDGGKARLDGRDVTLTIDSELQDSATQAVKNAVELHHADNGTAIVVSPETGDILAMANWPSFDPTATTGGVYGYNPAYMAQLEPGSTFKILTLAKGLDSGAVHMTDHVYCRGQLQVSAKGRPVHCDSHHGNRAHGDLDPIGAISRSCNVSAATWALRIGRAQMIDYIQKLGLLERTNVGVPKETKGLFRMDEYAQQLQLAHVGFGQSITCTPIALAGAFAMLANDGVRVPLRLIKKIGGQELPVRQGQRIIGEESADEVIKCMEAVIDSDSGTGHKLRIPGYRIGGKTGTAEKVGAKEHGYVSNFIGFVPAVKPKAVILVMVNNPHVGYYGAEVAGPAFKQIAISAIRRLNIPPSEGTP
jgi:cell division protein FtsI/penicillin-binding protein 2